MIVNCLINQSANGDVEDFTHTLKRPSVDGEHVRSHHETRDHILRGIDTAEQADDSNCCPHSEEMRSPLYLL